jgi:hypothetical protein
MRVLEADLPVEGQAPQAEMPVSVAAAEGRRQPTMRAGGRSLASFLNLRTTMSRFSFDK